jgi:hypothetical protein
MSAVPATTAQAPAAAAQPESIFKKCLYDPIARVLRAVADAAARAFNFLRDCLCCCRKPIQASVVTPTQTDSQPIQGAQATAQPPVTVTAEDPGINEAGNAASEAVEAPEMNRLDEAEQPGMNGLDETASEAAAEPGMDGVNEAAPEAVADLSNAALLERFNSMPLDRQREIYIAIAKATILSATRMPKDDDDWAAHGAGLVKRTPGLLRSRI